MTSKKPTPSTDDRKDKQNDETSRALGDLVAALEDPHTHQFLKSYLGITDEQLKAHIKRLADETGIQHKPGSKEK